MRVTTTRNVNGTQTHEETVVVTAILAYSENKIIFIVSVTAVIITHPIAINEFLFIRSYLISFIEAQCHGL